MVFPFFFRFACAFAFLPQSLAFAFSLSIFRFRFFAFAFSLKCSLNFYQKIANEIGGRYGAVMTGSSTHLWVIGGSENTIFRSDIWRYSIADNSWLAVDVGGRTSSPYLYFLIINLIVKSFVTCTKKALFTFLIFC